MDNRRSRTTFVAITDSKPLPILMMPTGGRYQLDLYTRYPPALGVVRESRASVDKITGICGEEPAWQDAA